jgi:hypothetical protein
MREMRNTYRLLVEKPKEKRPLERPIEYRKNFTCFAFLLHPVKQAAIC